MKAFSIVASLFLAACAHGPVAPVPFDLPAEAQSLSIPIEDLRPENEREKQDKLFSLLVTSRQYGIHRIGDGTVSPSMPEVFRWMVFDRLKETEKDLKISVYHMVAYLNRKSKMRRQAIGAGLGGAIGAVIASRTVTSTVNISQSLVDREQFARDSRAEARHAFYREEENPGDAPVFVIYIDAAVNDKRVFVRTMAPLTAPDGQYPFVLALKGAIQYWLDQYTGKQ